jgi:hypothetical protein
MSFQIDLLIHAANVLYLFAFMVRDILWLRILAASWRSSRRATFPGPNRVCIIPNMEREK